MTSKLMRWRRAATLVVAAMLAGLVSLLVQGTAHACSCLPLTPAERIDTADVVFVGTPVEQNPADDAEVPGVRWTFEVETVHKGTTTQTSTLETAADSAACGLSFTEGEKYLVFATGTGARIGAGLCSGTGQYTRADPELVALLGAGVPPEPASATDQPTEPTSSPTWPIVAGAGAVLVVGVGVLLLVRARRRS